MMNSAIVANINGSVTPGQKISSGLHSSLLMCDIEFAVTEVQTNASPSNDQKFLQKIAGKTTSNIVFNGHGKGMNYLDSNRNPQAKPAKVVNGNKNVESTEEEGPSPKVHLYVGKINSEWQQPHKIGAGLTNLGNTCFMNTVLQCLTYCPPLANYLLHDSNHAAKCKITGFCMMCELHRHMKRVIDRPGDTVKPVHIYQKLKTIAKHFQFGRQEDAHEFLRYVIDNMWKSCLVNYEGHAKLDAASKETTVINKIFGGYHRSQVTCLRCKEKNSTYDHFMDFILDVKQNVLTLQKALEKFIQPELLQNDNAYKCVRCKMKVSAKKKFTIFRPPNVATFQFKRFDYNRICGGKITKHISYPELLNLRPYMSDLKGGPIWYRLNAVLVHLGATCNSGHYYCFVRNCNGFWYIMDDTRVQQVSINQVLNQVAYVLFYVRTSSSENSTAKRPAESSTSTLKNNQFVKNGFVGSASYSVSSNSIHHSSLNAKNSPLPAISKLSVSPSPSHSVNSNQASNNAPQKRVLQPLMQNREKVSFGINSPKLSHRLPQNTSNSVSANQTAMKKESPLSQGLMNHNMLVPYIEDTSESSDEESKNSSDKRSTSSSLGKNINGNVSFTEKDKCAMSGSIKNKNETSGHTIFLDIRAQTRCPGNFLNEVAQCTSGKVFPSKKCQSPNMRPSLNCSPSELKLKKVQSESKKDSVKEKVEETVISDISAGEKHGKSNECDSSEKEDIHGEKLSSSPQVNGSIASMKSSMQEEPKDIQKENIAMLQEISEQENSVCVENGETGNLQSASKESSNTSQAKTSSDVRLSEGENVVTVKKKVKEKNQIFLVQDRKSFLDRSFHSQKTHPFLVKSAQNTFANERRNSETQKQNSNKRRFGDALENSSEKRASGLPNNYENSYGSVSKKSKTLCHQDKGSKYMSSDEALDHTFNSDNVIVSTSTSISGDKFYSKHRDRNRTDHTSRDSLSKNLSPSDMSYSSQLGNKSWTSDSSKFSYEDRQVSFNGDSFSNEQIPCQKIAVYVDSDSDKGSSSSRSSWEYEWVEKTKETMEIEKVTGDVRSSSKFHRNPGLDNVSNQDVITELQKHSSHMYGVDIGTWDNIRRNTDCIQSHNNRKYNYNDYDEELDKGKIHKKKKHQFKKERGNYNPFDDIQNTRNRHKLSFHNKWRSTKFRYNRQWKPYRNRNQNGYGHFHKMHRYPYFHRR